MVKTRRGRPDTNQNEAPPPVAVVTARTTPTKKDRTPKAASPIVASDNDRSELSALQKAKLHLHISENPECLFKDLLAQKPTVYRQHQDAYRQRFNYLRRKKQKDPEAWWKQFAHAKKLVAADKGDDDEGEDEEADKENEDEADKEEDEEEDRKPAAKKSTATTPPRYPKKKPEIMSKAAPKDDDTSDEGGYQDDDSVGKSTITSRTMLFGSPDGGRGGKGKNSRRFHSRTQVIGYCDYHFKVDLHVRMSCMMIALLQPLTTLLFLDQDPRKNGAPFFFVHDATGVKNADGSVKYHKLRLMMSSLIDVRFRSRCFGYTVLKGRGFVLFFPTAPDFFLSISNIVTLHSTQKKRCHATMEGHQAFARRVKKNEDVLTTAFFFEFPWTCTCDLESNEVPRYDQKLKVQVMQETVVEGKVSTSKGEVIVEQTVEPCFFDFRRIVSLDKAEELVESDDDSKDSADDYFQGKLKSDTDEMTENNPTKRVRARK